MIEEVSGLLDPSRWLGLEALLSLQVDPVPKSQSTHEMEKNLESTAVTFVANLQILSANPLDLRGPWSGEGCVNTPAYLSSMPLPLWVHMYIPDVKMFPTFFPKWMERSVHHLVRTIYLLDKTFLQKWVPLILLKTLETLKFAQPLGSCLRSLQNLPFGDFSRLCKFKFNGCLTDLPLENGLVVLTKANHTHNLWPGKFTLGGIPNRNTYIYSLKDMY